MAYTSTSKSERLTSAVWECFGYKRAKEQTWVTSKKCKKRTVTTKGGNTTNLFYHLKQRHPVKYDESHKSHKESSTATVTSAPEVFSVFLSNCREYHDPRKLPRNVWIPSPTSSWAPHPGRNAACGVAEGWHRETRTVIWQFLLFVK